MKHVDAAVHAAARVAAVLITLWLLLSCSGSYTLVMPYCPVSDSAKAHADSVPVACLLDSIPIPR